MQRAQITFADGLLDVRANNSSLNGILRDISRTTGMKLTGGVAEQRVFGNYGPAAPATVLATLLDGTGSNMLFVQTSATSSELILTPRIGGPSPPSAFSAQEDEESATNPRFPPVPQPGTEDPAVYGRHGSIGAGLPTSDGLSGPRALGQPQNNVNGSPNNVSPTASTYPTTNSVPLDSLPTPSTTPAVSGIVDAPNPPPGTTANNGTANGAPATSSPADVTNTPSGATVNSTSGQTGSVTGTVPGSSSDQPKTPEQVFELLQQLRQQSIQQSGKQ